MAEKTKRITEFPLAEGKMFGMRSMREDIYSWSGADVRTLNENLGLSGDDRGMSTVEYALGTVAAAAFGALLYTVVTGGQITDALTDIIERALNTQ